MDSLEEFKKYFDHSFWKAFQNKPYFLDWPTMQNKRDKCIEKIYQDIKDLAYYPSVPELYIDFDKGDGVSRIVPVFSLADYCVYYYCIKKIEDKIAVNRVENTYGGWRLGNPIREKEEEEMKERKEDFDSKNDDWMAMHQGISIGNYSFNPQAWVEAYGDLNAKLYATARETDYHHIAELDIANFYDSIRLDILEIKIREATSSEHADVVSLLFHFLNHWNRKDNMYNKQTVGIPQDAMSDLSRILANFYLQPYDKIIHDLCEEHQSKYMRYADDQFFFSKRPEKLPYLIFKASKALNSFGLSINQEKVKIMTTGKLISYRSFGTFSILENPEYKKDKEKVEKFVAEALLLIESPDNDEFGLKNNGFPLLNKALSCNALGQIEESLLKEFLDHCLHYKYLKRATAASLGKIYKLLDEKGKKDFLKQLDAISDNSVHNVFHYELMYFLRQLEKDTQKIEKRIEKLKTL